MHHRRCINDSFCSSLPVLEKGEKPKKNLLCFILVVSCVTSSGKRGELCSYELVQTSIISKKPNKIGVVHTPEVLLTHVVLLTSMLLRTLRKVKAMPPPMIISLTLSSMLLINWILSFTFALKHSQRGRAHQDR